MEHNTTSLISAAVAPFEVFAMDRAEEFIRIRIEDTLRKIEEDGGNINARFQFPSAQQFRTREAYKKQEGKYRFARRITKIDTTNEDYAAWGKSSHYIRNEEGINSLIEEVREMARQSFKAYVEKLAYKIGEGISEASVDSRNVWTDSNLTIKRTDGATEVWNTKIITNYSSLGLAFNQFPTRKMKR